MREFLKRVEANLDEKSRILHGDLYAMTLAGKSEDARAAAIRIEALREIKDMVQRIYKVMNYG